MRKVGLALGSGSARGWSHVGVIRCLMEAGIPIDPVCGSSVGALIAASFAAGYLDQLDRWGRNLAWSDILGFMDVTLPRSGLIEGGKLTAYFRGKMTDRQIEDLPIAFAAVATDLKTGKEVWLRQGSLLEAVRASVSLPGIFTPYRRKNRWLVDGGLVNPVPVSLCRALGADVVVAVNLNTGIVGKSRLRKSAVIFPAPKSSAYRPPLLRLTGFLDGKMPERPLAFLKQLGQRPRERQPSLFDVMAASVHIMQDCITQHRLTADPPDVLVTPRLAHVGLLEFNRAEEAIAEGYRAMKEILPALKARMRRNVSRPAARGD